MFCTYNGNRDEAIVAYLYDDGAAPGEHAAFEAHMADCAACREEVASLGRVRDRMREWQPPTFASITPNADARTPNVDVRAPNLDVRAPNADVRRPDLQVRHDDEPAAVARASFWRDMPIWAQTLAAMLVLGVAAGAANLDVHHDAAGLTIRTGWMAQPSGAAAAADAPWRAEVARLESELRAARESAARTVAASVSSTGASTPGASGSRASATSPSDAELLRQVRALIAQSEKREQTELALRIAQVVRDNQAERTADLAKVERLLNYTQTNATFEAARNREMINGLAMRVSQTVR